MAGDTTANGTATVTPIVFENTALPDIIELRGINQSYDGGKTMVLKDVNLLIENKPNQGQFLIVMGPSGCGKSTLLRYITGLQEPTSGEILIDGKPREQSGPISMVFQTYSSLPWLTVLENVKLGLKFAGINGKESSDRAMATINQVGLAGHEHKFAQHPILSGGQLQRVAIARSLVSNPQIVVMDEPFGALDISTRLQMQEFLAKLWLELSSTIVFVTHSVSEAVFLGDEVVIMSTSPGQIMRRIPIDLPLKRDRMTKRDPRFIQLTQTVEDEMFNVINGVPRAN